MDKRTKEAIQSDIENVLRQIRYEERLITKYGTKSPEYEHAKKMVVSLEKELKKLSEEMKSLTENDI